VKETGLPEWEQPWHLLSQIDPDHRPPPMWDQEGVHEIYRSWRRLTETYPGDRVLVGEAWVAPAARLFRYVRADEMHQVFNFEYLFTPWADADQRRAITGSLAEAGSVGAVATWVLSNHDVLRHATRLAFPPGSPLPLGIGATDPQPDAALGLKRARAATLLMLALPGSAYVYQGEELGLPEHTTLPDSARQDPTWQRSGHTVRGRDGCRVPIPWEADAPSYGFGPSGNSWLPQPPTWATYALDRQRGVPGSTYEMYRQALRLRRGYHLGRNQLTWLPRKDILGFGTGDLVVLTNFGPAPAPLPPGEVLIASGDLAADGSLPPDTTAWIVADPVR
jgi:alpha-glucosidase